MNKSILKATFMQSIEVGIDRLKLHTLWSALVLYSRRYQYYVSMLSTTSARSASESV